MSFDKIFDLTAGVYFHFYNIYGQYIVINARVLSSLSSRLPLGEEALRTHVRGVYQTMP